jgi:hypothetical protein
MAPRKAAAPTDETVAPRRSSRAATVKATLESKVDEIVEKVAPKKRKAAGDDKPAKEKKVSPLIVSCRSWVFNRVSVLFSGEG